MGGPDWFAYRLAANAVALSLRSSGGGDAGSIFLFSFADSAFTGLLWLMNGTSSRRQAFWDGWWWGWGFHIAGLQWLNISLMVNVGKLWWLIPSGLFGLTAYLGFQRGGLLADGGVAHAGVKQDRRFQRRLVGNGICARRVIADFPWNLTGYAFGFSDAALQLASVIGIYGLTWFAALLGGSFAALGDRTISISAVMAFATCVLGMFIAGMGFGTWRLIQNCQIPEGDRYVKGVLLKLVQSDIDKYRPRYREK